jgi:hypothetical protein
MGLDRLTKDECEIVLRCIRAVAEGPFLSEGDFHPIIGLDRSEVVAVASSWPAVDESAEIVRLAINNSMNALLIWFDWQDEYPASAVAILQQWAGATPQEVEWLLEKWREPRETS